MSQLKLGIVVSWFNQEITSNLLAGAWHALMQESSSIVEEWREQNLTRAQKHGPQGEEFSNIYNISNDFIKLCQTAQTKVIEVPGAFELPLGAKWLAEDWLKGGKEDLCGIVALGAVIKGDTPHDQYISNATTQGLMQLSLELAIPVGFGLITTNDLQQAQDRASMEVLQSSAKTKQDPKSNQSNKGFEAMQAVLESLLARELLKVT